MSKYYEEVYFKESCDTNFQFPINDKEIEYKKLRAEIIIQSILNNTSSDPKEKLNILEIGFGEGYVLSAAKKSGFTIRGFDFSSDALIRSHPNLVSYIQTGDPAKLIMEEYKDKKQYDCIVLQYVLEHTIDVKKSFKSIANLLNPTGLMIVSLPNDFSHFQKYIIDNGFADHEYWWAPPQHLQYFNSENFPEFINSLGFKINDIYGDFPIETFLLHKGSNYILNTSNGKEAHLARVNMELLMSKYNMQAYMEYLRAVFKCGISRSMVAVLSKP